MDDLSQKISSLLSDPEMMDKIQGLSGLLGQSNAEEPKPKSQPQMQQNNSFPTEMMGAMMKLAPLLSTLNQEDDTIRLLKALRPFLSEQRQRKLDEAIKMMNILRLLPLLKGSNIFDFFI